MSDNYVKIVKLRELESKYRYYQNKFHVTIKDRLIMTKLAVQIFVLKESMKD